jgi:hypothetical protein
MPMYCTTTAVAAGQSQCPDSGVRCGNIYNWYYLSSPPRILRHITAISHQAGYPARGSESSVSGVAFIRWPYGSLFSNQTAVSWCGNL